MKSRYAPIVTFGAVGAITFGSMIVNYAQTAFTAALSGFGF